MLGNSEAAERLASSQEGSSSIELVRSCNSDFSVYRRMIGWFVKDEFENVWNNEFISYFNVAAQQFYLWHEKTH
jgi:hypothetical protein